MNRRVFFTAGVLAVGSLLAVSTQAVEPPTDPADIKRVRELEEQGQDQVAVHKVLTDQMAAWNKGDLDGFMKGYWKDPGLFFISGGKSVKGFDALRKRYETAYQGDGKEMGKLTFGELHTEPLGPARLVRGTWEVKTSKETVTGWFTLVFKKVGGEWKIVHDHTSK